VAESGADESFGQILQNWSNMGSIFVAFIIAGLVPLLKTISKKYTKWKDAKDAEQAAKEKEAIIDIAKEVQQPLTERMNKVENILEKFAQQNDQMLDHMNIIEQLLQNGRISFNKGPRGRPSSSSQPSSSKHFDHSVGKGDHSDYHPK